MDPLLLLVIVLASFLGAAILLAGASIVLLARESRNWRRAVEDNFGRPRPYTMADAMTAPRNRR